MNHPVDELLGIMAKLRDPELGCPWDLKQDFSTIVPYTLEEAYEVAEAIELQDWDELKTELGDLLFQIVFYTQIASERDLFEFQDVVNAICEKMIRRHPHVFADQQYSSEQELQAAWDAHKRREQQAKSAHLTDKRKSVLDGVPVTMPALQRAEKLQRKAARVGFDWPAVSGALEKTREELEEVEEVLVQGNEAAIADELGDLLFAVVNVVRLSGMDAEQVLRGASRKFEQRFHGMEACLEKDDSINWEQLTLEEMESAWEKVKKMEKRD